MRAVVQRVRNASVTVEGAVTGSIPWGLLVYLGVSRTDTAAEVEFTAGKTLDLRIFPDQAGRMNLSFLDLRSSEAGVRVSNNAPAGPCPAGAGQPGILVVSQFTLYGDVRKGRRPSFNNAAEPKIANEFYLDFLEALRGRGVSPQAGVFREHMDVTYTNDGPVTILIDTDDRRTGT